MTHPFWGHGYKETSKPISNKEIVVRYKDANGQIQFREFKSHEAAAEFHRKHPGSKVHIKR